MQISPPLIATIVVGCSVLLSSQPVSAIDASREASQYMHRHWGRIEGLPSDSTWAVHQAANGYLWIGAEGGLVRFDGIEFELFSSQTHDAFIVDDVREIAEGPDNTIWAATFGSGLIRVQDGAVTRYDKSHGLLNDVVYSTHYASNGDVWAGTASGVCKLRSEQFACWTSEDGLAKGRVVRIAEDMDGGIWFASLVDGVSHFDGTTIKTYRTESGLTTPQTFMLISDLELNIFLGTYRGDFHHVKDDKLEPVARGDLPEGLVPLQALRDRNNNLWIGTNGGEGVWRLFPSAKQLDRPEQKIAHVFGMSEDSEGGLWVATSTGLHQFRSGPFVPWGEPEGLSDSTYVVEPAGHDSVWVGTEGTGLFRVSEGGEFIRLTQDDGLPINSVSSLFLDADDTLWVGTFGGGLAWVRDGKVTAVMRTEDGLAGNQIASIFKDQSGVVWIGTAGGLNRWVDGAITHTFDVDSGLIENLVRHITEDRDGHLLLSTDAGLMRFSPTSFEVLDVWNRENGLSDDVVATSHVDSRGVIWIGGRNGGLARLEGDTLFRYKREHQIGVRSIMTIIEDHYAQMWFGGRRGMARIARSQLDAVAHGNATRVTAQTFSEKDGLRGIRVLGGFQSPAAVTPNGKLWFATASGLTVVDPWQIVPVESSMQVLIKEVLADGKPVAGSTPYRIPAGTRSVQVNYAVPRLNDAEDLVFRYRLASDGERWQDAGARRTAFFTSLPARTSHFEVGVTLRGRAYPVDGSNLTRLELYVEPQWYQTYAARVAATAAVGLTVWVLYLVALRRLRQRQKRLECLVGDRTVALRDALAKVEKLSRIDILTGVANRRHFEERLSEYWERAVAQRLPISVMMLDIDYFKQFNDAAGHLEGDRCLSAVAGALADSVRDQDFVARYGGEEFAVVLSGSDVAATHIIGERIQQSVSALRLPHPGRPDGEVVTVSAGFATAEPGVIASTEELIRRADEALYRAKELGRDRVVMHRDLAKIA